MCLCGLVLVQCIWAGVFPVGGWFRHYFSTQEGFCWTIDFWTYWSGMYSKHVRLLIVIQSPWRKQNMKWVIQRHLCAVWRTGLGNLCSPPYCCIISLCSVDLVVRLIAARFAYHPYSVACFLVYLMTLCQLHKLCGLEWQGVLCNVEGSVTHYCVCYSGICIRQLRWTTDYWTKAWW